MPELMAFWLRHHVNGVPLDGEDPNASAQRGLNDPARYGFSVKHLLRFFQEERRAGLAPGGITVQHVDDERVIDRFIAFRRAEGVGGHTISRDLAALRGALYFAWKKKRIAAVPFIKEVDAREKSKPRDTVLTMEQVAAVLETAYRSPERFHVFLYTMIQLSTLGRSEAILELDKEEQVRDGLFYFLHEARDQTSKRRSIVPVAPTLAPWLDDISGKVIVYRAPLAEAKWKTPGVPEFFSRPCLDIGNAFEGVLIDAGLCRPVVDALGQPVMLPPRAKLNETDPRPKMRAIATPNTLRHTAITEMHRRGVPEGQIDTAAGHAGEGTGKRNYRHLRPEYLRELIAAVEDYWYEMRRFTTVHLRSQCGPKVVSMVQAAAALRGKKGA